MVAHRQIDGVYQWELSLPPAHAAALLSAACVDVTPGRPDPNLMGHWLWGPKIWKIRFDGNASNFRLEKLHDRSLDTVFGLPQGKIVATKAGCRVELRHGDNRIERLAIMALFLFPAMMGPIVVSQVLSDYTIWTRVSVATAIVTWFAIWSLWLIPWLARLSYRDMLDELFADYILPDKAHEKPVAVAYHAVPPCHGK